MAAPAKRIDGIDFWRGLALLTIFIDHVPENVFQHVTQKNFGFSDAAELFVFLSGVSVALAYGTRFFNGETVGAVRALLRRAFTLYWVQILISLVIIAIFVGAAALWDDDDLLEDADVVVSNPLQTSAAILALLHQLENANILPLYIALLLMTPLLLVLARRDDRLMLAASAGIRPCRTTFITLGNARNLEPRPQGRDRANRSPKLLFRASVTWLTHPLPVPP